MVMRGGISTAPSAREKAALSVSTLRREILKIMPGRSREKSISVNIRELTEVECKRRKVKRDGPK